MVDFRKWVPAVAVAVATLLGTVPSANAQTTSTVTCSAVTAVVPIVRAEGLTELVGDLLLNCTGGRALAAGEATPLVNVQIFLNTQLTSRIVASGTSLTEATLTIDDPIPGTQVVGSNVYYGSLAPNTSNSVVWQGVPFVPPGSATRTIRITNVRANASALGVSSTLVPSQIVMFISISGSASVPTLTAQQPVAFVQRGLTDATLAGTTNLLQCAGGTSPFTVRFGEGFGTSFKTRTIGPGAGVVTPQPILGNTYNSESGFYNPALNGIAGLADAGTRVGVRFANVGSGVTIAAPLVISTTEQIPGGTTGATQVVPKLRLIATDASGGSVFAPGALTYFPLPATTTGGSTATLTPTGGMAFAIYEYIGRQSDAFVTENFEAVFTATLATGTGTSAPAVGTTTAQVSFFPTSTVATASATAAVPRFIPATVTANAFTVTECRTNLLFPFVTNQAGFDTGMAISNTSQDPFGGTTRAQSGNCTLYFYGVGAGNSAAPAAATFGPVPAGGHAVLTLSGGGEIRNVPTGTTVTNPTGAPGFQGYVIATCNFQFAHGFAFITNGFGGTQTVAEGYLALVLDAPLGTSPTNTSATRTGFIGESLSN